MKIIYIILSLIFLIGCATDYSVVREKRLQKYLKNNPHADMLTVAKITRGMIANGMSGEEVIASWGKPVEIIKADRYEKWVYGMTEKTSIDVSAIVFFKDGEVIDWIN